MKKWLLVSVAVLCLLAQPVWAAMTMDDLKADPQLAEATAEQRLEILNEKINKKEMKRGDISGIIEQLYDEALASAEDPVAKLLKYGKLKKQHRKLPSPGSNYLSGMYWTALSSEPDATARLVKYGVMKEENKNLPSVSSDFVARLYWDALVEESDAMSRLEKYGKLRAQYKKLPSTSDVEMTLVVNYLSTNEEALAADLIGKMKLIKRLENGKMITWSTVSPLHTGMLAAHLAANQEYAKMSPADKLKYLKRLEMDGVLSNLTLTKFAKGIACELVSGTPADKQKEVIGSIGFDLDFFTKNAVNRAFLQ